MPTNGLGCVACVITRERTAAVPIPISCPVPKAETNPFRDRAGPDLDAAKHDSTTTTNTDKTINPRRRPLAISRDQQEIQMASTTKGGALQTWLPGHVPLAGQEEDRRHPGPRSASGGFHRGSLPHGQA